MKVNALVFVKKLKYGITLFLLIGLSFSYYNTNNKQLYGNHMPSKIEDNLEYNKLEEVYFDKNATPSDGLIVDFYQGCSLQYDQFKKTNPDWKHVYLSNFNNDILANLTKERRLYSHIVNIIAFYKFSSRVKLNQTLYIVTLEISEIYNIQSRSNGGSSFRIMSYSQVVRHCGYKDHFNGLYTVSCVVSGNCSDIVVQLSHIQFNHFKGYSRTEDLVIWKENICVDKEKFPQQPGQNSNLKYATPLHGMWHGTLKNHTFITNDGYDMPIDKTFLCSCFNRWSVDLIGASHLRNAYYCLRKCCWREKVMKNVEFVKTSYFNNTLNSLKSRVQKSMSSKHPRLFVVQSGSWDLAYTTFTQALNMAVWFANELGELQKSISQEKDKKLIFVNTPSLPNESLHPLKLVSRTNEITAVLNKYLKDALTSYGIEYIDMFSIAYPFYRERPIEKGIPSHHYLTGTCKEKPGLVALQMVFYKTCFDLVQMHHDPFQL